MRTIIAILSIGITAGLAPGADHPLPLGGVANVTLDDPSSDDGVGGWTDQGPENSLDAFPRGRQTFSGVAFDIPESGKSVLAMRGFSWPEAPASVSIPVEGIPARTLFLLSAHAWTDADVELARVRVRYRGGTESTFPLVLNRHTGPWWYPSGREQASVAWRGENRQGVPVGVYIVGFPLLEQPVDQVSVDVNAMNGQLFILGLTLSDIPAASLPVGSRWQEEDEDRSGWFGVRFAPGEEAAAFKAGIGAIDGRRLWMELSAALSAPAEGDAIGIVKFLSDLGYSGARLAPLDVLAARPGGTQAVVRLAEKLKDAGLGLSVGLAGGKAYGAGDGVAAFRELDPRAGEVFFVDPAATTSLHANLDQFIADPISTGLGPSTLLRDSGFFSYHMDDLTRPHRRMLINRWCEWLRQRHKDQDGVEKAWQVEGEPPAILPGENLTRSKINLLNLSQVLAAPVRFRPRISDQITFLEELQLDWFFKQKDFANRILPPANWSTTAWISPGWLQDIQIGMAASFDFVEISQERILPRIASPPGESQFSLESPFSEEGLRGFLIPYYRVTGKPYLVWDATAAWPGDREFLRVLRTFVMASLQGWEGLVHRILTDIRPPENMVAVPLGPGPALQNPSVLALLPLGRNLYLRGDITPLPLVLQRPLLTADNFGKILPQVPSLRDPLGSDYPAEIPFLGSVEAGRNLPAWRDEAIIGSEKKGSLLSGRAGEVSIDPASDFLQIMSPKSVALAGKIEGRHLRTGTLEIGDIKGYGITYATALDDKPLVESKLILIGLIGKSNNSGSSFEKSLEPRGSVAPIWRLAKEGTGPIIMSPLRATFIFGAGSDWLITPLDPSGRPLKASVPKAKNSNGRLVLEFDNAASGAPLFLLEKQ